MKPRTVKTAERQDAMHAALAPLYATVTRCEWCRRRQPLQGHHVAQGFRYKAVDDRRFILDLCEPCHSTLHRMAGDDNRACGLALLRLANRGSVAEFHKLTGRRWPAAALVDLWTDRLIGRA